MEEDSWTAFSDVGTMKSDGSRFSLDEYMRIEGKYVEFFRNILREAGPVVVAEPRLLDIPLSWQPELINGLELSESLAVSLFRNQLRGAGNGCSFYLPRIDARMRTSFDYYLNIEADGSFGDGLLGRALPDELSILLAQNIEAEEIITRECDDEFWKEASNRIREGIVWVVERFAQGAWGQDWYSIQSESQIDEVRESLRPLSAVFVLSRLDFDVCVLDDLFDGRSVETAELIESMFFRYPIKHAKLNARPLHPTMVRERLGARSTYAITRQDVADLNRPNVIMAGVVPGDYPPSLPRWLA